MYIYDISKQTFGTWVNIKFAPEYEAYTDCIAAMVTSVMHTSMIAASDPS